jgi:hypothetical protein
MAGREKQEAVAACHDENVAKVRRASVYHIPLSIIGMFRYHCSFFLVFEFKTFYHIDRKSCWI